MIEKFQTWITGLLLRKSFRNDEEINLFLISLVATFFCFAVHVLLLTFCLIFWVPFFIYANLISFFVYFAALTAVRNRRYTVAGVLISLEVCAYATIFCLLFGITTYTLGYYVLVLIMQVIMPYGTGRLRGSIIAFLFVGAFAVVMIGIYTTPPWTLSQGMTRVLMVFNTMVLLLGTLVELYIGNIVKNVIDLLNEVRMAELTNQANTDPLTGLYNRRYADAFLRKLPDKQVRYVVAMADIDDFKRVNDTYGHGCGDEVLKHLADYFSSSLRKTDLVFRWGGEEFLLMLANVDLGKAKEILEKIRYNLTKLALPAQKGDIHITITIGAAELDPNDPMGSIDQSDELMYQGKTLGKNRVMI